MKLLTFLLLTACASTTYRDGQRVFRTNADVASLSIDRHGALTMTGVNHSTPQRAIGETVISTGKSAAGVIGEAGAAMVFH